MHAEIINQTSHVELPDMEHHVRTLLEWIRDKKESLLATQDDFHSFHMHMRDLEHGLLRDETELTLFEHVVGHLTPDDLTEFNNIYCQWETQLERRFVNFLDNDVVRHYLDYPLFARFERLIQREVNLLQGYQPKKLLFIGSGPMPITALCLQHRLGTEIDCLERFQDAVDESKVVMKKLGMEGAINVFQGYGEDYDVSDYDVVLVALLAKPKRPILENILRHAADDVRVICRTSDNSRHVFYEPTLTDAIPEPFVIKGYAAAGIDDTISSVLLRKELQS